MKILKVLGLAAIAAGMFSLTSCLDGGGNTQQLSSYAIVDYSSTMRTLIYPLGYYPLYVATIVNDPTYSAGDCVLANFTVDFDSADNANASTNGFYVETGAASSPLAKYDLSYSPLDSMALDLSLIHIYREYPVVGPGDQSWISRELDGGARGFSCRFADEPVGWDFFFPDPVFPRFSRSEANEPEPGIVVETFPV